MASKPKVIDARASVPPEHRRKGQSYGDKKPPRAKRKGEAVSKETLKPTSGGAGVTSGKSGRLQATLQAHTVAEYDGEPLGAIWVGVFRAGREPQGLVDTSKIYPTSLMQNPLAPNGAPLTNPAMEKWARENAQEVELGRELYRVGGLAIHFNKVTRAEWSRMYDDMVRAARSGMNPSAGSGEGGLLPPLGTPTSVTSAWGTRDGVLHRGVDLAASVGSPVQAPADCKVDKVWVEKAGGQCVRLALKRPDGGFADDSSMADDSGIVVTYAHLTPGSVAFKEGDEVSHGAIVALSGNSGTDVRGDGHLHVMTEYVQDAPFWSLDASNGRILMDPVDVWGGEDAITGVEAPAPPHAGDVYDAAIVESAEPHRLVKAGNIVVEAKGSLVWGGGAATGELRVVWPHVLPAHQRVTLDESDIPSGDGGLDFPEGRATRDVGRKAFSSVFGSDVVRQAEALAQQAGGVLREVGGQLVAVVLNPETHQAVLRGVGMATGAAGAAATVLGPVISTVAPFLAAIPYVGAIASPLAEAAGAILSIGGPLLAGSGAVQQAGADILGAAFGNGKVPPLPFGNAARVNIPPNGGIAGGLNIPGANTTMRVPNPPGPIPSVNVAPGILPF